MEPDVDPQEVEEHSAPAWVDDMPAWGISFVAHVLIAVGLASISWVIVSETELQLTSEAPVEEPIIEEYVIDTEISQVVGSNSLMKIDGASIAAAQDRGTENHPEEIEHIEEVINPTLPIVTTLPVPSEAELLESVDLTGTTEHAGGTEGAIDRITWEIAASLRERKTLVVWLFDESLSLKKRRSDIADRFESIYTQLEQMNVNAKENLTTGIVGFGELLIIKHDDVYLSAYGHNDRLLVAEGARVAAGQQIAEKGSTGTDVVKLHFEIRKEGKPIDPLQLLPRR